MYAVKDIDPNTFQEAVASGQPYKPLYVKFKLVWTCNLRCVMCNHWRDRRAAPLRIEKLRPILDDLAELGTRKVHLSGGEPTLHPDLLAFIEHAANLGMRVSMTTNATLIDKEKAKALISAGLKGVNVSLDSPERRLHEKIRGVDGCYKQTVQGIEYLAHYLNDGKVRINTVVTRKNYHSLIDLPDFAARVGAGSINLIPVDIHTPEVKPLGAAQLQTYNQQVAPVIAEKGMAYGLLKHPREAYPFGITIDELKLSKQGYYAQGYYQAHRCYAPYTHALIDHEGRVLVCCMLREAPVLGDLRQQSFREIWYGEVFAELRQQQTALFDACHHCDMFTAKNRMLDLLLNPTAEPSA